MVRSSLFQSQERSHPDPIRIAAISAAIVANIGLLAVLMRPPEFAAPTVRDTPTTVTFVTPEPKKIEKRKVIEVKHEPVHTVVHRIPPVVHDLVKPPPVLNDNSNAMSTDVPPLVDSGPGPIDIAPPQPVQSGLNAITSPAPTYPREALRDGITGTVELELVVGIDGRVVKVTIVQSSGNRELDRAASDQVLRNWRFQPAMRDGVAIQSLGRVPIVFKLDAR